MDNTHAMRGQIIAMALFGSQLSELRNAFSGSRYQNPPAEISAPTHLQVPPGWGFIPIPPRPAIVENLPKVRDFRRNCFIWSVFYYAGTRLAPMTCGSARGIGLIPGRGVPPRFSVRGKPPCRVAELM
jgi:hypothetical protein